MSTDVTKVSLRFPIAALVGKDTQAAYTYFTERLGHAQHLFEEADGTVISFGKMISDIQPIHNEFGHWGAEVVLCCSTPEFNRVTGTETRLGEGQGVSIDRLSLALLKAIEKGFTPEDVIKAKLYAYTWYSGTEEPITFE
jgi:hypothetical protein